MTNSGIRRPVRWLCDMAILRLMLLVLFLVTNITQIGRSDSNDSGTIESKEVRALSDEDKAKLQRRRKRFEDLTAAEQQRIRTLHATIESRDDRDALVAVINRYGEFLKSLSSSEKKELLDLPREERLDKIRAIKAHKEKQRLMESLSDNVKIADVESFVKWLDEIATRTVKSDLKKDPNRRYARDAMRDQRSRIRWFFFRNMKSRKSNAFHEATSEDIQNLRASLGEYLQALYAKTTTLDQKRELTHSLFEAILFNRIRPQFEAKELERFAREKLDERARRELKDLKGDAYARRLEDFAWYAKRDELFGNMYPRSRRPWFGRGPGRPPGEFGGRFGHPPRERGGEGRGPDDGRASFRRGPHDGDGRRGGDGRRRGDGRRGGRDRRGGEGERGGEGRGPIRGFGPPPHQGPGLEGPPFDGPPPRPESDGPADSSASQRRSAPKGDDQGTASKKSEK